MEETTNIPVCSTLLPEMEHCAKRQGLSVVQWLNRLISHYFRYQKWVAEESKARREAYKKEYVKGCKDS